MRNPALHAGFREKAALSSSFSDSAAVGYTYILFDSWKPCSRSDIFLFSQRSTLLSLSSIRSPNSLLSPLLLSLLLLLLSLPPSPQPPSPLPPLLPLMLKMVIMAEIRG